VPTDGACGLLVAALGADYDPAAAPGFVADGHEYYLVVGAERLREVLPSFSGGNVLIAILGGPFKCPPVPSGALLLHDYLVDRGVRDASRIDVISAVETPIPVSPETSVAIVHALAERDIGFTGHETGMRRGEVVGLRWQDVDFDSRRYLLSSRSPRFAEGLSSEHPNWARARVSHSTITRSADCGLTKMSRRSNAPPGAQAGMTPGWSSRARTADRCDRSTSHCTSKRLAAEAGLPVIRLHDLRHTNASVAFAAGVDITAC
jgi:Phage integrase family